MKRFLLLTVVLLLVFNFSVMGQTEMRSAGFIAYNFYNFDFLGGGARAAGMGKAYYAVSNDITGGSWNPAGIFEIEQPTIGLSWSAYTPNGNSSTTLFQVMESDHSGSFSSVSSFNFVSPMRLKGHPFVFSFNYTNNFDIFEQFSAEASGAIIDTFPSPTVGEIIDTIDFMQTIDNNLDGGLYTLNFAFGTRLYNDISFGVSANVYTGNSLREQKSHISLYDYLNQQDLIQRGLLESFVTVTDTNKFSGMNFTIGFMINKEKYNAGLIIKTPFKLKASRQEAIYSITAFNDLTIENGTDTIYFGDLLLKYEMPLIIGAGINYKLSDNMIIAADVEFKNFKGNKILYRESVLINPGGANEETFFELDPGWRNVFGFRIGTEYLKESSFGTIPIRFGAGYAPVPDPNFSITRGLNMTLDTTYTGGVTAYNLSAGSGIHWEQIHFDFSFTYNHMDRNYNMLIPTSEGAMYFESDYKVRNNHFSISFTGIF